MTTYLTNDGWAIKKGYKHFVRYIVTTLAAASITTGDYFFYNNGSVDYYVWMDKNGDGTTDDPGPLGSKTGVAVDISAAVTAIDVANALTTAIDALTGSNAEAEDDVVYITNTSNDNLSSMSDSNTGFTFSSDGFLPNNDYPPAATLTSFREDSKAIMDSNVRGTPSATDTNYLRNLEYRMVELMMDEEQGRETEDGRPIYIPRDYLFQRDRITLAGIGSTGFTRGGTSH